MNFLLQHLVSFLRRYRVSQRGQTTVEYGLILAVISVIAIGVFSLLGSRILLIFSAIANILDTAQTSH